MSILFERPENAAGAEGSEQPPFFADLNLDQVLASMTSGRDEYNLKPLFYTPLHDAGAVGYRHEVMRDLEEGAVLGAVRKFAQRMREMHGQLAQARQLRYKYQRERWGASAPLYDAVATKEDMGASDNGAHVRSYSTAAPVPTVTAPVRLQTAPRPDSAMVLVI